MTLSIKDGDGAPTTLKTNGSGTHVPHHVVDSSALPSGAATSALQDDILTALAAVSTAIGNLLTTAGFQARIPANGQATMSASVPVVVASNQTAIPVTDNSSTLSVDDGGSSLTVDGTVSVSGTVTVGSHAVTNAGTFAVQVDGSALTSLQTIDDVVVAEDAAHGSGDKGVMALAVRRDANTTLADTTGDYAPLQVDANGSLKVAITAGAGSGGTASTDDGAFTAASGSGTPMMGFASSDAVDSGDVGVVAMTTARGLHVNLRDGSGNAMVFAEDAAHTTGDPGLMMFAVRRDANTTLVDTTGDYAPLQVDSAGSLKVAITAGAGSGGTASTDDGAFTAASGSGTPMMGFATTDAVDSGDVGVVAMTTARGMHVNLRDGSGNAMTFAEDSAHTTGDPGLQLLAVRTDTAGSRVDTDGDYESLQTNDNGALRVCLTNVDSGIVGPPTAIIGYLDDVATSTASEDSPAVARITSYRALHVNPRDNSGNELFKAEDVAHTSGDPGLQMLAVRKATPANLSNSDGDYEPLQVSAGRVWASTTIDAAIPAGNNNIGDVDVASVPTDPFGANADAASATGSISAKLRFIASTGIPVTGTVTVGSHAVTNAGTFVVQENGAALTALQLIDNIVLSEDLAAQNNDPGVQMLAVRKATPANLSGNDGDYEPLQVSAGRLWASATIDAALPAGTNAIGKLAANSGVDIGDVDVTSVSAPSTVFAGQKTVTTAGTEVSLASSQTLTQGVWIKALHANTGFIYVGLNGVTSTTGFVLDNGESVFVPIANISTIFIDSSVNGEGVSYLGF
jgi:hypothetical protein